MSFQIIFIEMGREGIERKNKETKYEALLKN